MKTEKKSKDEFNFEAKIYDRIWGKRDYDAEVKFLHEQFKKHGCRSVIDIGCGTGNHALLLSRLGYDVMGVDVSPTMLEMARSKNRGTKACFIKGDMKHPGSFASKTRRFDAAISLGHASSHLYSDKDLRVFLQGVRRALRKNGLFVFNANNARKISEDYLNKLLLDHATDEESFQIAVLAHNTRDPEDPNIIHWNPIYLINEKGKVDLQIRAHKLRWFQISELEKLVRENGFEINAIYSGPLKEKFDEDLHRDAWFVATAK
jgi:SAM-dependent methyltransferase